MKASEQIEKSYLQFEYDLKNNLPNETEKDKENTDLILKLAKDSYVMSLLLLRSKDQI